MNKKRIATIIVAASLTMGLVGGSLAWFTSSDEVTNKFALLQDDDNVGDAGIDIWENYNKDEAGKLLPGSAKVSKYVQVQNIAKYNQIIRVKIDPTWISESAPEAANPNDIKLDFGKNLGVDYGTWYKAAPDSDGQVWYYYLGKIGAGKFTDTLLEKVSLSSALGNEYKNAKFDIKVEAQSVQASKGSDETGSPIDQWGITDQTLAAKLNALITEDKVNSQYETLDENGVTATGSTTVYSYN
jgi:predicted ribosomally synthesized peptide with SipW-like signal peptide